MKAHKYATDWDIFLGDSWFGNVLTVDTLKNKLGAHFISVVNQVTRDILRSGSIPQ